MKLVRLGLLVAASAAWALLPQAAAAQCEGGTSRAGYYLRDGSYVPGGCAYTSTTTPGQLHPSGAQPLPSTSPAQGLSALPGQPVATGSLPATSGDMGQAGTLGGPIPSLGPGSPLAGAYPSAGLGPATLTTTATGSSTSGPVNAVTSTEGLPPTVNIGPVGDVRGAGGATPIGRTSGSDVGTPRGMLPSVLPSAASLTGGSAYGYSLPAGPAVSSQAVSPTAPNLSESPPPPGRGGPSYIGEESEGNTAVTTPDE